MFPPAQRLRGLRGASQQIQAAGHAMDCCGLFGQIHWDWEVILKNKLVGSARPDLAQHAEAQKG